MRSVDRLVRFFWTFPKGRPESAAFSIFSRIRFTRSWALQCFIEAALTPSELFESEIAFMSEPLRAGTYQLDPAGLNSVRYELTIEYLVENGVLRRDNAEK